jgi:hypothetical protein
MGLMRLRVPELLQEHGMTAYELHKRSAGSISLAGAYRLARGDFRTVSGRVLEALCEVFGIEDPGPLLARSAKKVRRGRSSP